MKRIDMNLLSHGHIVMILSYKNVHLRIKTVIYSYKKIYTGEKFQHKVGILTVCSIELDIIVEKGKIIQKK